jgi:tRNA (guanine37-N1)-methyltransferase
MIDATVRLLPNVLGNPESTLEESHSNGLLEYPQYTKPAEWRDQKIPEILLSGHHHNIANWRMDQAKIKTQKLRPDLWEIWNKSKLQK